MKQISLWLSCVLLLVNTALANDVVGNAVAVIGTVSVLRVQSGETKMLANQSELFLNDVIITGPDGLAKLLLRDETILKISPNSEVVISEMIAGPNAEGRSSIDLLKGRLRSVIGNKLGANTAFDVNTPVAVAGVRGTDFEVVHILVDGDWVSGVRCFDGSVALSTPGLETFGDVVILPSQYSLASNSSGPSEPIEISAESTLADVLGVSGFGGLSDDAKLDVLEIQSFLLNINDFDVKSIEHVIQSIGLQQTKATPTKVEIIKTEIPLLGVDPYEKIGETLEFELDVPGPPGVSQ